MLHTAAYYESVDPAAALTNISAVADQAVRTSGNNVVVPSQLQNLVAEAALTAATGPSYAQVQSPTLRAQANQDVLPIIAAVVFGGNPPGSFHFDTPRALKAGEDLSFAVDATGGAAAANYGLVWLADGPVTPVKGRIFSVRATGAATLSAGAWVNTSLTFDTTLPAGNYQVVGLRAQGTNLVAARLVFVGGTFRPGVPAQNAVGDREWVYGRFGRLGVLGSFNTNQPPTIDNLGVTDTSQTYVLDLMAAG